MLKKTLSPTASGVFHPWSPPTPASQHPWSFLTLDDEQYNGQRIAYAGQRMKTEGING